jgi:hypothetical protein
MVNNGQASPTAQVIEEYKKNELIPKRDTAQAELTAADTRVECSASNRQYKICTYVEGQRVSNFYNTLDFCEAIAAVSTSSQVVERITKVEAKNADLKKQFDEVVKAVKDLRMKLYDVEMKAYDMGDAYEDPTNTDQVTVLQTNIGLDKAKVTLLVDRADKTHDQSNMAFSTAVDVAGTMTFTNIESLKGFGAVLSKKTTDFKKNVDDNVKKSGEDMKKAQQDLSDASKTLMLDTFSRKDPAVEIASWNDTEAFLSASKDLNLLGSISDLNITLSQLANNYEDIDEVKLDTYQGVPEKSGVKVKFDPNR